jgi:CRISPR-associated protein Cmr3
MTTIYLTLTALDPIVARDGRPFGEGQGGRMKSLRWPTPSVAAGSLRTAVVKADPRLDFAGDMPERLQQLAVAGPFPAYGGELYLPAPADAVFDGRQLRRRRPINLPPGAGTDLPTGLMPLDIADPPAEAFKPKPIPAWWPVGQFARWLTDPAGVTLDGSFLLDPDIETRDHVRLDPDRGAASDGDLFSTSALHLSRLRRYGSDGTARS